MQAHASELFGQVSDEIYEALFDGVGGATHSVPACVGKG